MANMLPPEALRELRSFHRTRFLLVGLLFAGACGAFAILVLLPTYIIVRTEHLAEHGQNSQGSAQPSESSDRSAIVRAQLLVKGLRDVATSTTPVLDLIEKFASEKPADVSLTSFSLARGNPGTIVLAGSARTRDAINNYRALLAKDPRFKSVTLPVAALTGSESGRFTMTITANF